MPVVEATLALLFVGSLIAGRNKGLLITSKLVDHALDRPRCVTIETEEGTAQFTIEDYIDDSGNVVQDFMIVGMINDEGEEVLAVITKHELKMMQTQEYLENLLQSGVPVGRGAVERAVGVMKKRIEEIPQTKSRLTK